MGDGKGSSSFFAGLRKEPEESWSTYIDRNIRFVRYGVVGIGIFGLCYASRSIRMAKQFHTIDSIPPEFFEKHFTLYGVVRNVMPVPRMDSTAMINLQVDVEHIPIMQLPQVILKPMQVVDYILHGKRADKMYLLNIYVPAVKLHRRYFDAIRDMCVERRARFTLLEKCRTEGNYEYIVAQIVMLEPKRLVTRRVDLGKFIVGNGYGCVVALVEHEDLIESLYFCNYYSKLCRLEEKASKNLTGIWSKVNEEPRFETRSGPVSSLAKLLRTIQQKFQGMLKKD